jgi:AAA+ superfamily predicted ATPase
MDIGSITAPTELLDPRAHFRAEMGQIAALLRILLLRSRERGRSPAGEGLQGFVIEDGEAEGMVTELSRRWSNDSGAAAAHTPAPPRGGTVERAVAGGDDRVFLPLRHAARNFALTPVEYLAMLLALAVEADGLFGRLVAYLNDHVGRTRPTIGLAIDLAGTTLDQAVLSPLAFSNRPAVRDGLFELEGDGPAPGLSLRVPRDMALRLVADAAPDMLPPGFRHFAHEPGLLERLVLGDELRGLLSGWAHSLRNPSRVGPLILAGAVGAGRTTAARAAVGELALPLLVVDLQAPSFGDKLRAARREACWHGAPLLIRIAASNAPEQVDWPGFWAGFKDLQIPMLVAATPETAAPLAAAAPTEPAVITVPEPQLAARAALWRVILPSGTAQQSDVPDQLAARFQFNPGRIHRAVQRAMVSGVLGSANARGLTANILYQACRDVGAAAMGPLAQKLSLPYAWDELVVPPAVAAELELARTWMREQRQVLDNWGFARRLPMGRGLTMLFSGQPGTGKTMAAQVLARELALDLYRVDLSRVVDKYVGETEKNLARLFDEAQAAGAILFFDEADALFGKRSEVKDAHDRYANLEIGYLLQRMEEYEGVTILASNRARDMDEAFTRRFHFLIDFPMPDEAHRLKIWAGMFPPETQTSPDLDLRGLAKSYEISGGEIKNAVFSAAFMAAGEGVAISTDHIRYAVKREFQKSGKVVISRG